MKAEKSVQHIWHQRSMTAGQHDPGKLFGSPHTKAWLLYIFFIQYTRNAKSCIELHFFLKSILVTNIKEWNDPLIKPS